MYVPLPTHKMLCLPHDGCDTQYERNVTCVDAFGETKMWLRVLMQNSFKTSAQHHFHILPMFW